MNPDLFPADVVIVGGGPMGLNAALGLGRAGRRVILFDGADRPAPSTDPVYRAPAHGDSSAAVRRLARGHLAFFGATILPEPVVAIRGADGGFGVLGSGGGWLYARKLLLATGLIHDLPTIPGLAENWGDRVLPCPRGDGSTLRDEPVAVVGSGAEAIACAIDLGRRGDDVVLFPSDHDDRASGNRGLAAAGVRVVDPPLVRVEAVGDGLRLVLADGSAIDRRVLFVAAPARQRSPLVDDLGCALAADGRVRVDARGRTTVSGVFAVGEMTSSATTAAAARTVATALIHDLAQRDAATHVTVPLLSRPLTEFPAILGPAR